MGNLNQDNNKEKCLAIEELLMRVGEARTQQKIKGSTRTKAKTSNTSRSQMQTMQAILRQPERVSQRSLNSLAQYTSPRTPSTTEAATTTLTSQTRGL